MPVEMEAVVFDGTHTAERELSDLRLSRSDPWLTEVAVLERHSSGRFSMKATSPEYVDEENVGRGIALGGGTGLLLGLIGGPLGLLFWGALGAITGGAVGAASSEGGVFQPLVDEVRDALPFGSSALMLVAEKPTADKLVSAVGSHGRRVIEHPMSDEQVEQLKRAVTRR